MAYSGRLSPGPEQSRAEHVQLATSALGRLNVKLTNETYFVSLAAAWLQPPPTPSTRPCAADSGQPIQLLNPHSTADPGQLRLLRGCGQLTIDTYDRS